MTAYVLKFMRFCKKRVTSAELTPSDVTEAKRIWIKYAQLSMLRDHFRVEISLASTRMDAKSGDVEDDYTTLM